MKDAYQMSKQASRWLSFVVVVLAGFGLAGCKDKKKCDEALNTTREALKVEDTALARQWRDRTWKMCGDATQLGVLDGEILAKEEEIAKKVVDAAKAAREAAEAKVGEIERLWRGIDKLDAFQKEGKKFERDKVEAEIKSAFAEGKRMLKGLDEVYAKQIGQFHSKQYKKRLKMLEEKAAGKKK